ncbi:Polycystic kidney disease and receptor for egg jelly-related protein, partial [Cuculus canorus]
CYIYSLHIRKPPYTSVLECKRGAPCVFYANLKIDCNIPKMVQCLWRVYPVLDTTSPPDWEKPINSSLLHGVDIVLLTIPSYTLEYGLYLVYFNTTITALYTKLVLRASDQIYVKYEKSRLVANIAGGTFRVVGYSDNWTLDGSASYDPDSHDGQKGITFTWYCTKEVADYGNMKISPGKKCHPSQRDLKWLTSSGPVQIMAPESLPGNAIYYFRLEIQKDSRSSYADQTVDVEPGSPVLLDARCLENCGSALIPTQRFTLSGKCLNCRTNNQPVYHWSLLSGNSTEISLDWSSRTSTGRSGPYLSIRPGTFTMVAEQAYTLQLKAATWDGRSSIYRHTFIVNSPPRAGKCTINPRWGTAFQTKFVVQCSGFLDNNLPLTYKVIIASSVPTTTKITSLEENTFGPILYFGYQFRTPPSVLPVGVPSQRYTLTLYVQVYDSLGAFTQVSLCVRVWKPVQLQAVVFHELLASVNSSNAPMASHLQTGDSLSASYLAYLAASVLNSMKATPTLQNLKAQFRESLIQTTLNISAETTMEINQVVAALSQITEEASEVNPSSQDLVIKKLTEVAAVLKVRRNESYSSEEAEIQSSGILRCLSNTMRAAVLHQRNVSTSGVKKVFSILEKITDIVLQGKVPGEKETLMETKHWTIALKKDETRNIANASSTGNTCRNCFYPSLRKGNNSGLPPDAVISTALFEFEENSFPWLGHTSENPTMVLGFAMAEDKAHGNLRGIVPEGAEITLARREKASSTFPLSIGPDKTQNYTTGGFAFKVNRNTKTVYIQILTKLEVSFQVLVFTGTKVTHSHPRASFTAFHNRQTVASKNETGSSDCRIKGPYIICLPRSLLTAIALGSSTDTTTISIVLQAPYVVRYQTQSLVSIHIFSDQCLSLDGAQSLWREDTCRLGSSTDWQRVHCVCNMEQSLMNLSGHAASNAPTFNIMFLAAKVIVSPNPVDLGKILITDIPRNPVTLCTVLGISAIYFCLSLWALRKDRTDRDSKHKIIVLPDNNPLDQASFLVTLYTGSRWGAGTKADVFLQLIGRNGTSDVHCLWHPQHLSFQRGSIDCFLLTPKKDLGDICSIMVWHNNKGPSPSWFLSRATVENISRRKTWFFMCRKWLSLDKGDRLLAGTFAVTNPKTLLPRLDYFLISLTKSLREDHLWFSIFARVLSGTFSRFQRLSSCLATLLLNLLGNIVFFNAERNEASPRHLRYLRSIAVGTECVLVTMPVEMTIKALFKHSQKEFSRRGVAHKDSKVLSPLLWAYSLLTNCKDHLRKSDLSETTAQSRNVSSLENLSGTSNSWNPPCSRKTRSKGGPQSWQNCTISERDANIIEIEAQTRTVNLPSMAKASQRMPPSSSNCSHYAEEGSNFQKERKPPSTPSMPFWKRLCTVSCRWGVCLSWVLVIAVTGISSPFIVLYGLSYGSQTSQEWLLASVTSFVENVFVYSVLQIIFFSAMRTIRPKSLENIPWLTQQNYSESQLAKETMGADEMREMHLKVAQVRGTKL